MKTPRLLLLVAALSVATSLRAADLVNGIAVLVNQGIITHQDVQLLVMPSMMTLQSQFTSQTATPERRVAFEERLASIERDGLDQLINRQLVLSEYRTKGYNLPESVINDEVERRIKAAYDNRVQFIKTLKAQGRTYESFRAKLRDDFIYSVMKFKNVSQDLIISPAKIERYYAANTNRYYVEDEVKLRIIVLNRTRVDDASTTRKRAEEILFKIKEGADFAEMAQANSDGSQRAQGGDWGWVERKVLRKELVEVAFGLQPGQHSDVIETPESYYLMLVEDKRVAHLKPIAEVRNEIEKTLLVQEQARLEKNWLDRLKNKAFVRYF